MNVDMRLFLSTSTNVGAVAGPILQMALVLQYGLKIL